MKTSVKRKTETIALSRKSRSELRTYCRRNPSRTVNNTSVKYLGMANYKEFWNDSILVVLVSSGNVFYAQKVSELEIKQTYDARKDFERFEDIFTRVNTTDLANFRAKALQIMKK